MRYYCPNCGDVLKKISEDTWECAACRAEAEYLDTPECCNACGGDYPNCTVSCPMFDD